MRIQSHPAVAIEPSRGNPVTRQPSSASSTPSATKPTFLSPASTTSTDPFTSLFQALSGSTAGSTTTKVVPGASIFSPKVTTAAAATTTATSAVTTAEATAAKAATAAATASTGTAATTAPAGTSGTGQPGGIQGLVSAIMNGSFRPTYVTDPSQLQETSPGGTDTMPNFYYASDQTAAQLASILGGTVVQMPAFGHDQGWTEPLANFIQLPNGQTVNAAGLAYYANCASEGGAQLTADLTQTINQGAAWTNYYMSGGPMPYFVTGQVGPPISGMTYPAGSIGADGNVINPAMQGINT